MTTQICEHAVLSCFLFYVTWSQIEISGIIIIFTNIISPIEAQKCKAMWSVWSFDSYQTIKLFRDSTIEVNDLSNCRIGIGISLHVEDSIVTVFL